MSRSEPLCLRAPASTTDAQLFGQANTRRGLREGATALRRARAAYLSTEWSGDNDRRPAAGLLVWGRL